MCVIRSMVADNINHNGACLQMNTGEQAFSRPSLGSWLTYGLGSENQNLPGFVVISPAQPAQGAPLWSSSFLPAAYQGTLVSDLKNPIANLRQPASSTAGSSGEQLDAAAAAQRAAPRRTARTTAGSTRGSPAFELAFRMQARGAGGVRRRPANHRRRQKLYGLDDPTHRHLRQAVPDGPAAGRARRAVRAGLPHADRQAQRAASSGTSTAASATELPNNCAATDKPIAGLLDRPEGARPARRHAGRLGRRVRPHADRRGHRRPRAPPVRLHDVAGRRRRQGRA